MLPPNFSDVGKPANDLLNKDYPVGVAKLEVNTTTDNNIKFTVTGNKDNSSGVIGSELKAKYTDKPNGVTFTETWSTANVLTAQVELDNSLAKGLKLDASGSLAPAKGTKTAKAGFEYKQEFVFTRSSLDLFKTTISSDVVFGHSGFVAGADVAYDVPEAKVTKHNYVLGYLAPLYSVSIFASNKCTSFAASYHHKVNPKVEAAAKASYNKGSDVTLEVGSKYVLDSDAFLKAKVNNVGLLGLGYTQVLRPGIKLALAGLFDTTRLQADVHKVGFQLTFEG